MLLTRRKIQVQLVLLQIFFKKRKMRRNLKRSLINWILSGWKVVLQMFFQTLKMWQRFSTRLVEMAAVPSTKPSPKIFSVMQKKPAKSEKP